MSHLLTLREQKIMRCIGAAVATRRDCDLQQNTETRVDQTIQAVEALIEVFGDQEIAERLSPLDADYYRDDLLL
jgi:hypothetical protein